MGARDEGLASRTVYAFAGDRDDLRRDGGRRTAFGRRRAHVGALTVGADQTTAGWTAIVGGTVIDGRGGPPIVGGTVLVRGDRIDIGRPAATASRSPTAPR